MAEFGQGVGELTVDSIALSDTYLETPGDGTMAITSRATVVVAMVLSLVGGAGVSAAGPAAPDADKILQQMSQALGAAQKFSFKATRALNEELAKAHNLQPQAQIEVFVQRPNAVVGTSTSPDDSRTITFDGHSLTLLDVKNNLYSSVPLQATLDQLPQKLAEIYGFTPPLADFVLSDIYKNFRWRASAIVYAGQTKCSSLPSGGAEVDCDRIALKGKFADSELWIASTDHLPRKMTATVKGAPATSGPTVEINFTDWDLNAPLTGVSFQFTPPDGAQKVPMMTAAEIAAASKNGKK